ncbi:MAG: glycosyltransferase family 4 protein [Anaerolineales bacterium]|nr:glycosyltransferase family 4 protein [Anaerolineales bacterium]
MKLLITTTAYPPSIGGAQSNLHQLSQAFGRNHQVRVASFWAENRADWLLGTTLRAPGGEPYQIDGVQVFPLNYSFQERIRISPYVFGYYLFQSAAIDKLSNTLVPKLRQIAGNVDLIHHGRIGREPLGFASLKLARQLDVPFILSTYHHPRWNTWMYRNYHDLYRQADAIIALTGTEKHTLVQLGVNSERIFVTGHGAVLSERYDPESFRNDYMLKGPVVLFLGQKYQYKGFDKLLQAAPLVWEKHPDTHFVFIGPRTRYSEKIFHQVRDARILELGIVDLATKTSALAACQVLCLPSSQECFGGVFVEAWTMGKPVIGMDIPALSEVVSDGIDGFVGPNHPAFLAEKIRLLLGDAALAQQLGTAGREKVERYFEWPALARHMESIYQYLTGGPSASVEETLWK